MNCLDIDRLHRQNQQLKHKVNEQNTKINCLNNDLQTQYQLVSRQKNQIQQLKQHIKSLNKKMQEQKMDKDHTEHRYLSVLQKLQEELDQYKLKYNKLENKIAPLVDQDTVRLKVLNEVEGNHQLQLNLLKNNIQQLKDDLLTQKRQNQVLKHALQNEKMAHQQEMRRKKSRQSSQIGQDTINYLTYSMWKDLEAKLQHSYQQAKKEAQFYKEKYFACEKKYHAKMTAYEQGYLPQTAVQ